MRCLLFIFAFLALYQYATSRVVKCTQCVAQCTTTPKRCRNGYPRPVGSNPDAYCYSWFPPVINDVCMEKCITTCDMDDDLMIRRDDDLMIRRDDDALFRSKRRIPPRRIRIPQRQVVEDDDFIPRPRISVPKRARPVPHDYVVYRQ